MVKASADRSSVLARKHFKIGHGATQHPEGVGGGGGEGAGSGVVCVRACEWEACGAPHTGVNWLLFTTV